MTNLANKEKNLNELIEKLSNLSNSYSHDSSRAELLKKERDSVLLEKSLIEKKQHELLMEHKYLKDKILKLEQELKKKNELQDKFSREIDELSQETEELVEELLKAHPDYGILSEEVGVLNKQNKDHRWIIDPIDGTFNFLNGIPHFAISIGYEEKGEIVCGMIFDPIKNETFFAEKGTGAFFNNSRIRVTKKNKLINCALATGGPKSDSPRKENIFEEYTKISRVVDAPIRKFGSAALGLAYVAAGRFDAYWEWELNYWDVAAGIVILKEAGGYIEFLEPEALTSNKRNVIATNSNIHEELKGHLIKKNIE